MKNDPKIRADKALAFFMAGAILIYIENSYGQRPDPVTVEGCRAYLHSAIEDHKKLIEDSLHCISATESHINYSMECSYSTRTIFRGYSAWPQCGNAQAECDALRRQDDAYQCLKEARAKATESEKAQLSIEALNKAEKKAKDLKSEGKDMINAWNDPQNFFKEKIGKYVKEEYLSEFKFDDVRGRFTERGESLIQQTYDFLFNKTAGNKALYASNPIISAIQGSAADELRRVHSQMIHDFEQLQKDAAAVSLPDSWRTNTPNQTAKFFNESQTSMPSPPATPKMDECAVLDGPERTQMATEETEKFEALLERCKMQRK
jgi:hypothetical protein